MVTWTCDQSGCNLRSIPLYGACDFCGKHFCHYHNTAPMHICKTRNDAENRTLRTQSRDHCRAFHERLLEVNFKGEAERLRHGRGCTVKLPESYEVIWDAVGSINYHIPITFDDGVKWLARVRRVRYDSPPSHIAEKVMHSEIPTLQFMNDAGLKVPMAFRSLEIESDMRYFFIEYIEGSPHLPLLTIETPTPDPFQLMKEDYAENYFHDLACFYIELSEHTFDALGMVQTGGTSPYVIDPMFGTPYNPVLEEWFGPFQSNRDRYCTQIDHVLDNIRNGVAFIDYPIRCYLVHLAIKEMVLSHPDFAKQDTGFYICHQDAKGDHLMVTDDGHVVGVIDWEWAITTTKAEAFIGCQTFLQGDIDRLARTFENLGRRDLASCVRGGNKYRYLKFCVGDAQTRYYAWPRFRMLVHSMTGEWLDDGSMEIWGEAAKNKYWEDQGLQGLLTGDQSIRASVHKVAQRNE